MKHNKKLYEVLSVGGLSTFLMFGFNGCVDKCTSKVEDECRDSHHSSSATFIPTSISNRSSGYFSPSITGSSESVGG